ncbi:transglutaminase family protein [Congregibacter brevis]|jgi:hypothetical protein|uniref:Transglutaminase family protein n=1 Tax=Congregibacter brevis TaxID=3081201 RepID=A0ABZ0IGE7_9GAMM|nr:transglutaminase family protein [Congregibacter sp. IMCC45268]
MSHVLTQPTPLLDYRTDAIQSLIKERGWLDLAPFDRIGAAYDFVREEILFGYNVGDALPASKILSDGFGQCNTKSMLLMALLRGLGIPCRFHGFTIKKSLQRGIVPELIYPIAPQDIIHSWVEIEFEGRWLQLEGFILDSAVVESLQRQFPERSALCAYGAGTDNLQNPGLSWEGTSTFVQSTGINQDFGLYDAPDDFYASHRQLTGLKGFIYRHFVRRWMNRRVHGIRKGKVPRIGGRDRSRAATEVAQQ